MKQRQFLRQREDGRGRKARTMLSLDRAKDRCVLVAIALLAIWTTAVTRAEEPRRVVGRQEDATPPVYLTVTRQDALCVVKRLGPEKVLFSSDDPSQAIEWALEHSRIAVLAGGQFSVKHSVTIPRSGVSLIIAPDATLQAAEDAQLTDKTLVVWAALSTT